MPKRMTICLAVAVTFSRSLDAPVVISPKTISSAARPQGGLVDEVGEIGAGEARRLAGERVEVDDLRQRLAARVHLEDLLAAAAVGAVDDDLAVEAARAQQRGVEDVRAVRRGDEDDVVL